MTQEQVVAMVEEMGLPFAYDHFAEGQSPEPPFLVFLFPESRNPGILRRTGLPIIRGISCIWSFIRSINRWSWRGR